VSVERQVVTLRLGASNIYLLPHDGGYIAIDAGADYEGAWPSARAQLAAAGIAPAAVQSVLITHGHLDHCGLARDFRAVGARILIGRADEGKLRHGGRDPEPVRRAIIDFLARSGVPDDLLDARAPGGTRSQPSKARDGDERLANLHSIRPEHGSWPAPLRLSPGEADCCLEEFGSRTAGGTAFDRGEPGGRPTLRCLPVPGHTPGSFAIFDQASGDLYTGDHVLEKIAPTAGIVFVPAGDGSEGLHRFRALPHYLASLAETRKLMPLRVLPGHGEPFTDLAGVTDRIVGVYEQRAARLLRRLGDRPATAWELAWRLYPHLRLAALWLILSEIVGLLDLLEDRGLARLLPGVLLRYERAAG
jgi:glyoxylase-like metal-dependent hydrolase (beta-lactamase superfamily II)